MSFADMRSMSNLIKYLGLKKDAAGVTVSLDGRCVYLACQVNVLETREEKEDTGKKPGKVTKVATLVELVPINTDVLFRYNTRVDMRRAMVEISADAYAAGDVLPFQKILEPTANDLLPAVKIRLLNGIPSWDLTKVMRIYLSE
jgi:hypothetical protein